jgi:hypothetical protein
VSRARFHYALEPLLLTRRWALDALLLTLAECNAAIAAQAARQAATRASLDDAAAQWRTVAATEQVHSVQTFALNARYLADLGRQLHDQAAALAALDAERDAAIAQVMDGQRALEAVERHRDSMRQQHMQKRASADFKVADDQWNTRQPESVGNGH